MILDRLGVSGLRNIGRIEITANREINWIIGPNGAGKTSLLEAIALLARGRSFRGARHGPLINRDKDHLEISARLSPHGEPDPTCLLRLWQGQGRTRLFENGQPKEGIHKLRNPLRVRVIADNSQHLLEGQPRVRRLFLDWNLFHVEHGFGRTLSEWRRALAQRNAWLRSGAQGRCVWNAAYCRLSTRLTASRQRLVDHLEERLRGSKALSRFISTPIQVRFRQGWPRDSDLADLLQQGTDEDRARGYTFYGPGRADFAIQLGPESGLPSRGQTKLLVVQLQLAAERYWMSSGGPRSVWLLDDISSELDTETAKCVVDEVSATGGQVFATALGSGSGQVPRLNTPAGTLFHVEQGRLVP